MKRICVLTGSPGAGKTTIVREALTKTKIKAGGFYTEEIRANGLRQGFKIITLDGQNARLAYIGILSPYRVGKYGVDADSLDDIGVPAIYKAMEEDDLIVVDEIGKMELFSSQFREAVSKAMDSDKKVLATIMLNSYPFADEIKARPEVQVISVTRDTQNQVLDDVIKWLEDDE